MIRKDPIYWARWLFLPTALLLLVTLIPCSLAFIKNESLHSSELFWNNADFWVPCIGGLLCGVLWMAIVVGVAPTHKLMVGAASFVPGAWLAWLLIGETRFRVGEYMSAFGFDTRTPVFLTWWAGVLGLAAMWFRGKRASANVRPPSFRRGRAAVLALVVSVALFCGLVLPSGYLFAKWTLYHWALRSISADSQSVTLKRIQRLARVPGFDLDWTPGRILSHIPYGFTLDLKTFGCPSCRGIHMTLLQAAARHGHEEVVAWMVRRRGTIEYWHDRGWALLDAGIGSKNVAVVNFLLDKGADATATNVFGSVMHRAVIVAAPPAVMTHLLEAGAPINCVMSTGLTPLDCAHIWHPTVIPFLRSHGATNAMVRVSLIPLREEERLFMFEGTDYAIQLPEGFSPWNRVQTPSNCVAWEVRNAANSSLSFSLGRKAKPAGQPTTFKGFPAVTSSEENDWGTCWCATTTIAFDASGTPLEEGGKPEKASRYDAILSYQAFNRRDQRVLEKALQTFFVNKSTEAQPAPSEPSR